MQEAIPVYKHRTCRACFVDTGVNTSLRAIHPSLKFSSKGLSFHNYVGIQWISTVTATQGIRD